MRVGGDQKTDTAPIVFGADALQVADTVDVAGDNVVASSPPRLNASLN